MQRYTFWSNSQQNLLHSLVTSVVRANAKIHILKQFTTNVVNRGNVIMLYVLMQRYTFWSNSQLLLALSTFVPVVRANAKIHILKQFTTVLIFSSVQAMLYVLMQRYTFWSNSQHQLSCTAHLWVVRANAKIHILKQFTTLMAKVLCFSLLYVLMQRYTFWSNSQLSKVLTSTPLSCTC